MTQTYNFIGINSSEAVKVIISDDRQNIKISSSLTGYVPMDVSDKFYDNKDEKEKCLKLTEEEYFSYVLISFGNTGYKFIGKE